MKKLIGLVCLVISTLTYSQNIDLDWVYHEGNNLSARSACSFVDEDGNVIHAGDNVNGIDLIPGPDSLLGDELFIQKFDRSGAHMWSSVIYGWEAEIWQITSDDLGFIYITGEFTTNLSVPYEGTYINMETNGDSDVFIIKMNAIGESVWVKSFGGQEAVVAQSISVDSQGNVYTCGTYKGEVDFNPEASEFIRESNGAQDIFVHKLNSLGYFEWAYVFGSEFEDYSYAMDIDNNDEIVLTGSIADTLILPGSNDTLFNVYGNHHLAYLIKMNTSAEILWSKQHYSSGLFNGKSQGYGLKIDENNNIYTVGMYEGEPVFCNLSDFIEGMSSQSSNNGYLQKHSSLGECLWTRVMSGPGYDFTWTLDVENEQVIVGGLFENSLEFHFNGEVTTLNAVHDRDIFFAKYSVDGDFIYAKSMGGMGHDFLYGIKFVDDSTLVLNGAFENDLNLNVDFDDTTLVSQQEFDFFLLQIHETDLISGIDELNNIPINLSWDIFPNPCTGSFTIKNDNQKEFEYSIYSSNGSLISNGSSNGTFQYVQISSRPGIYMIRIESDDTYESIKLIIN